MKHYLIKAFDIPGRMDAWCFGETIRDRRRKDPSYLHSPS